MSKKEIRLTGKDLFDFVKKYKECQKYISDSDKFFKKFFRSKLMTFEELIVFVPPDIQDKIKDKQYLDEDYFFLYSAERKSVSLFEKELIDSEFLVFELKENVFRVKISWIHDFESNEFAFEKYANQERITKIYNFDVNLNQFSGLKETIKGLNRNKIGSWSGNRGYCKDVKKLTL